jgi:hypothetical protein
LAIAYETSPVRTKENAQGKFPSPLRGLTGFGTQIPLWAIFVRPAGALN